MVGTFILQSFLLYKEKQIDYISYPTKFQTTMSTEKLKKGGAVILEANEMRFNVDRCAIMHLGRVVISVNLKWEPAICETIMPTKS